MIGPVEPKYQWGQRVQALQDLLNDGTYPERGEDELLAAAGAIGEIVQIGMHAETNTPVYLVEFSETCVLGCLEAEIAPV